MKLSAKEARDIARKITKANTALWNAIGYIGEVLNDDIVNEMMNNDEHRDLLVKLAKAYKKLKKNDDGFIEARLYGRDFDDYDDFIAKFQEVLDEES